MYPGSTCGEIIPGTVTISYYLPYPVLSLQFLKDFNLFYAQLHIMPHSFNYYLLSHVKYIIT